MYKEDEFLQLSGIQHFSFCKRQWALIHVENQWVENELTAEGRIEHSRVHDEKIKTVRNGVLTLRGLNIKSEKLGCVGICDAVEFVKSDSGISLHAYPGSWRVFPVEYKHGESKISDCDRLQLAAQAICLEEMFGCEIPYGYLFYNATRRRECVAMDEALRMSATEIFTEMHQYMTRGLTPVVATGKACTKCSLKDLCLPDLLERSKKISPEEYLTKHIKEGSCYETIA